MKAIVLGIEESREMKDLVLGTEESLQTSSPTSVEKIFLRLYSSSLQSDFHPRNVSSTLLPPKKMPY